MVWLWQWGLTVGWSAQCGLQSGGGGDGEMVWVFLWPQVGAVVGLCSPLPPLPHPLTGRTQVPLATGTLSWDNYLGRCYWSELMCLKS